MAGKEISEKHFEMLFTWAALQDATLRKMHIHAPTSYDEYKKGYDAKLVGTSSFKEIYLQFKAPNYSERDGRFSISITPHQHTLLQIRYPAKSAYYVFSLIRSMSELNAVQSQLKAASEMLSHYVCIDAAALPAEVDFIHVDIPAKHTAVPKARYKVPEDGDRLRTARHVLSTKDVLRGHILMNHFKRAEAGHTVRPAEASKATRHALDSSLTQPALLRSEEFPKTSEFGIAFRTTV